MAREPAVRIHSVHKPQKQNGNVPGSGARVGKGAGEGWVEILLEPETSKVDKEDCKEVKDILSDFFLERTKNTGVIITGWADQREILSHPAIGGFVSHCRWNSVMEAAQQDVPVLTWPQHGDQRLNVKVVEEAGLGLWERDWDWGVDGIVKGEEIERKIVELMTDEKLRERAKKVREEARKAIETGGSSDREIRGVINSLS